MQNESLLASIPDTWEIATTEEKPLETNFAPRMDTGETLDAIVSVTLTDVQTGKPAPPGAFTHPASISGTWAIQWIAGALLRKGIGQYAFVITARIGPDGRKEASVTILDVLY